MHLGLLTPETPGHLNPSTTLGRELARRGHRVRVVTSPRVRHKVERAGLELAPIGEQEDADGSSAAAIERLGRLRGIRATLFTGWLLCQAQKQILRDLPEVIAARSCPNAALIARNAPSDSAPPPPATDPAATLNSSSEAMIG